MRDSTLRPERMTPIRCAEMGLADKWMPLIEHIVSHYKFGTLNKVSVRPVFRPDHFFVLGLYDIHDEETITKTCFVPQAKEEWAREALIRNALIHGMRKLHACHAFKRECFKKAEALMPQSCAVGRDS